MTAARRRPWTDDVEAMRNLIAWLPAHIPPGDETCIVHGDFRLENSIFHPSEPRATPEPFEEALRSDGHPFERIEVSGFTVLLFNR